MLRTTAGLVAVIATALSGFDLLSNWMLLVVAASALVLAGIDQVVPHRAIPLRSEGPARS